jgi:hypothetical protein
VSEEIKLFHQGATAAVPSVSFSSGLFSSKEMRRRRLLARIAICINRNECLAGEAFRCGVT